MDLLLVFSMNSRPNITKRNQPSWLENAIFYQVYPQSFLDSNGDGIGDLPGLISKLDYLQSLGVTAIWLNPIFDSPMRDAGYDVRDFLKVDARYGTNEDAARLFVEAHLRGIRVVLDLVAGHTSNEHPWFLEAASNPRSPVRDFYIFTEDVPQRPKFGQDTPITSQGEHFVANYLPFQPALNYGYLNPAADNPWEYPPEHPTCLRVRQALQDIMKYWLALGCDGFRVDMANSLIKGDTDAVALRRLWQGFRSWFDREYPEAVLISEWSHPINAIDSGFHIDFLIHFGEDAYLHLFGPGNELHDGYRVPHVFFEKAGQGDIQLFLKTYMRHLQATHGRGYIALPTGNHDFQRPRRGREIPELFVAYAFLFTMPGVPFIYYGDEIGMRNIDDLPEKEGSMWRTGNRTPMQWIADAPNLGFSAAPAPRLYLPVDDAADAPTVSSQQEDPGSLLQFVRTLIALRRSHPALANDAEFEPLFATSGCLPFVYQRACPTQRAVVVLNPAGTPRACPRPRELTNDFRLLISQGIEIDAETIQCKGLSYGIFLTEFK